MADEQVDVRTTGDFFPMYCGATTERQEKRLYDQLEPSSFCPMHEGSCFSVPNYNMEGDAFDPDNYWRGPVWNKVNWMLMNGLSRCGFERKARAVREDIVELVSRFGFHEYFDPYEGTGYRGRPPCFWTWHVTCSRNRMNVPSTSRTTSVTSDLPTV